MCLHYAFVDGGESNNISAASVINDICTIQTAAPRKNTGLDRGGIAYFQSGTGAADGHLHIENIKIPLQEILIESGHQHGESNTRIAYFFRNQAGTSRILAVQSNANGQIEHFTEGATSIGFNAGTSQGASPETGLFPVGQWRFLSSHILIAGGTAGFIRTFVEDVLKLDSQNIDTAAGATSSGQTWMVGEQTARWDDTIIRGRAIRVKGVASGTPASDAAVAAAGSGQSATAYGWQSTTDSSEGAGGADPDLAAGVFRLWLKLISFPPEQKTGGFVNNEAITVAGLTGTILVDAPHAGFKQGLYPGSQFYGRGEFIERLTPEQANGIDTSGTLVNAATTGEALQVPGDGKQIDHTASAEDVTVPMTALGNQATILEIGAFVSYTRASSDVADPNGIQDRNQDNATPIQSAEKQTVPATFEVRQKVHDSNAAGGQWTKAGGAGGLNDLQRGYRTSTT